MSQSKDELATSEGEFQRKAAVACFNRAWDLLDKKSRTGEEDMQMLAFGHASRYHWGNVGKPDNWTIGDWQLSRIYVDLKQPALALLFAKSALDTCEKNNLSEMLLSAFEAMARAYAVAKDSEKARLYVEKARQQLATVKEEEDRKIYAQQIDETQALISNSDSVG